MQCRTKRIARSRNRHRSLSNVVCDIPVSWLRLATIGMALSAGGHMQGLPSEYYLDRLPRDMTKMNDNMEIQMTINQYLGDVDEL